MRCSICRSSSYSKTLKAICFEGNADDGEDLLRLRTFSFGLMTGLRDDYSVMCN